MSDLGSRHASADRSPDPLHDFYEHYGWERGPSGHYRDAEAFVDLRPVTRGYRGSIARRIGRLVQPTAGPLLDLGCGAAPMPTGADTASTRVCVDVTSAALRGARGALRDRSTYVQADGCRLPFADNAFERVLCAHVLYHLPRRRQLRAMVEIHRVLRPGGLAVIVYAREDTPPVRLVRALRRRFEAEPIDPPLHRPGPPYYPIDLRQLCETLGTRGIAVETRASALFAAEVTRFAVPDNVLGRVALALASAAERVAPRLVLPLANYPMLMIRKDQPR